MRLSPPSTTDRRDKRYGWYRVYEDFPGHPKWLLVVARSGVELTRVEAVVQRLFQAASKARSEGYIGGFDISLCAVSAQIAPEEVAAVYRTLQDVGFIRDNTIVDWTDRNPIDKTATDRQRNKRARDDARRAVASGAATPEQEALLEVEEREALRRLAALSRVTAAPPSPPPVEAIQPFVLVHPKDDTLEARERARGDNDQAARVWLVGDATLPGAGYGVASKIVADNFGCNRLNADTIIRGWLRKEMAGDCVTLASIISGVEEFALNGDGFRTVVAERIATYVRERESGPALPLGMRGIKGGRAS